MRAPRTLRVDVWHDTICPWCRIGLHNLATAAAGFTDQNVELIHHAFQLDPSTPAEGVDLRARLAESDAARAAARRGVRSVPFFEIGGRSLSGAQSPEALVRAMREATRAP